MAKEQAKEQAKDEGSARMPRGGKGAGRGGKGAGGVGGGKSAGGSGKGGGDKATLTPRGGAAAAMDFALRAQKLRSAARTKFARCGAYKNCAARHG